LKVMKSQSGQYISPLLMVGIKSLFNLEIISGEVSPVNRISKSIKMCMILLTKTISTRKIIDRQSWWKGCTVSKLISTQYYCGPMTCQSQPKLK
jgi:hypothetical protein